LGRQVYGFPEMSIIEMELEKALKQAMLLYAQCNIVNEEGKTGRFVKLF